MRIIKRIILALFFAFAVCSGAMCDNNYDYIVRDSWGADWYLDKYYFVHEGSAMLHCRLKVTFSSKYRSYLLYTLKYAGLPESNDSEFRVAVERASYMLFFPVVDTNVGYIYTAGVKIFDVEENLLVFKGQLSKLLYFTMINEDTEKKVLAWINKNCPTVYDSNLQATLAEIDRQARAKERERMRNASQSQVVETECKDNNMSTTAIVVFILAGVAIASALIGLFLEFVSYIMTGPDNLIPPGQPGEKVSQEAEVIDAEFIDANESDEYEYPYEDIGKVVGEGR